MKLETQLINEANQIGPTTALADYYAPTVGRYASPIPRLVAAGVDNRAINALMMRGADSDGDGAQDGDHNAQREALADQLIAERKGSK